MRLIQADEDLMVISMTKKQSFYKDSMDSDWEFWKPNVILGVKTNIPDRDIETEVMRVADDISKLNGVAVSMEEVLDSAVKAREHFKRRLPKMVIDKIYKNNNDLQPKIALKNYDPDQTVSGPCASMLSFQN